MLGLVVLIGIKVDKHTALLASLIVSVFS